MNLQYHDLLILILPGLIAFINRPYWSGQAKFIVAVVVCFIAAAVETWLTGTCSIGELPANFGKVATLTFASYATVYKAWRVGDKIEERLNPGSPGQIH